MSDRIYTSDEAVSNESFVIVAQSAEAGKLLTKRNYKDSQKSYDHVTFYNFYEVPISTLDELYMLCKRLLDKPKCCLIRARIKDLNKRFHVVRKYLDETATLILEKCYWIALDIDWKDEPSTGKLVADANTVLLALPLCFRGVECFAVASASYGIKPGIRMRLFFWLRHPVSNVEVKRVLKGYEHICDPAIFNPIQPIYTAKPIFHDIDDPVKQRIISIIPLGIYGGSVDIPTEYEHYRGAPEKWYTTKKAINYSENAYLKISEMTGGERHDGLISQGYLLGKLVAQGHLERNEVTRRMYEACEYWNGKRDTDKDMKTIIWAVDSGIKSMDKGNDI